tara:strand:- start:175 stop:591 length:417 start_codon:yes stop_codon:yes gene_type:complete
MQLVILPVFLGFFTFFYLFLSMRIGYLRGSPVMKLFFKMEKEVSEDKLNRNVRAHGNFSEYFPLFSLLLLTLELMGNTSNEYLIVTTAIFSFGRLSHAICFAFFDYNPFLRISGMLTTYLGLSLLAYQNVSLVISPLL